MFNELLLVNTYFIFSEIIFTNLKMLEIVKKRTSLRSIDRSELRKLHKAIRSTRLFFIKMNLF